MYGCLARFLKTLWPNGPFASNRFFWTKTYIKYTVFFLILVFYTSFSIIFGILEGLFQVFWYPTTPPGRPCIEFQELLEIFWEMYPFNSGKFFTFTCIHSLYLQKNGFPLETGFLPGFKFSTSHFVHGWSRVL